MIATHQLMANSMSNTAARLDLGQKQAKQIQTRTVYSSNEANSGSNRDRMSSINSVVSSSSISDQSAQAASARVSANQQSNRTNKRRERSTDEERISEHENQLDIGAIATSSSSSSRNYVAGPINARGGQGYNKRTTPRPSLTTTRIIVYTPPTTTRPKRRN